MSLMEESEGLDVVPDFCTLCGQQILCPFCERPTDRGIMLETEDPELEDFEASASAVPRLRLSIKEFLASKERAP